MKTAMYIDDLTAIDFSVYHGGEIRGDSVSLCVVVAGDRNDSGMISDFGKIKPRLKAICDKEVDHRLVCDPQFITVQDGIGQGEFPVSAGVISSMGPIQMYCPIAMTAEHYLDNIKSFLLEKFSAEMPMFDFQIELKPNPTPSFQYNHGLKLHDGNCQRIIHGHSADLQVIIDGKPCVETHRLIASSLNGKHFFNESDVMFDSGRSMIRYSASQGNFEVQLPNALLELVEGEPSIENISRHIAKKVHTLQPNATSIQVRVSEGLSKGAVTLL